MVKLKRITEAQLNLFDWKPKEDTQTKDVKPQAVEVKPQPVSAEINDSAKQRVFDIPVDVLDEFNKSIKRLENKCNKAGVPYTFRRIGDPYEKELKHNDVTYRINVQKVELDITFKISGWIVRANMVDDDGKIQIYSLSKDSKESRDIAHLQRMGFICQHCNKRVRRKSVMLLENTNTGELKIVGSTCLKEFTGGLDGETIALSTDVYALLSKWDIESDRIDTDTYAKMLSMGTVSYPLINVLTNAISLVDSFGFSPSAWKDSTANELRSLFSPKKESPVIEEYRVLANSIIHWGKNLSESNSYLFNIKQICQSEYASPRDFGIIASMYNAYTKDRREKSTSNKDSDSNYVGNTGERLEFNAVVDNMFTYEYFDVFRGSTMNKYIYLFKDSNGNILKWNTSKYLGSKEDIVGKSCVVKGTVDKHEEYKGVKQTSLQRCKVTLK